MVKVTKVEIISKTWEWSMVDDQRNTDGAISKCTNL